MFLLLAFIACILGMNAQNTAKIVVRGLFTDTLVICNVEKNVEKSLRCFYYEFNGVENEVREYTVQNELDGERLFFSCNHDFTYLEIEAGGDIIIELEKDGYKISGANQEKNRYLYEFCHLAYGSYASNANISALYKQIAGTNVLRKTPQLKEDDLFLQGNVKAIESLEDKCLEHLQGSGISDEKFIAYQKLLIKYLREDLLLCDYSYALAMKYKVPAEILGLLEKVRFQDEDLLKYPRCWLLLSDYSRYLMQENKIQYDTKNKIAQCALKIDNLKVRERYVNHELQGLIQRNINFNLLEIFDVCKGLQYTDQGKEGYATLRSQAERMVSKMPKVGEPAYPFAYKDKNGKMVRLSDFKGKYVFVDIWATWCGPCKAQMPYLKQLEKDLAGKNIAFVSICVNQPRDRQKWLDYIENNDMAGYCLMADNAFKDEMMVKYNVKAIPRFILIDPEGKLISADTPQPRDSAFRDYLKSLFE